MAGHRATNAGLSGPAPSAEVTSLGHVIADPLWLAANAALVDLPHDILDGRLLDRQVAQAGGRVAIVDFRKDAPQGPPVEFRFTPDQISAELAQAGFQLQTAHDFLPQQLFLIYRVK